MGKYHKDERINEAYEVLNQHVPNIGAPHDTHDELIEFNVVEAMMDFARIEAVAFGRFLSPLDAQDMNVIYNQFLKQTTK